MKNQQLRELSTDELVARRNEIKQELLNLRLQHASGQLESTGRLRISRREISRIETILSARRLNITIGKPAAVPAAPEPAKKRAARKAPARKAAQD